MERSKGLVLGGFIGQRTKKEAVRIYWDWAKKWRDKVPKAVNCLEKDLGKPLRFYRFPPSPWEHIRTTNILERAF